MSKHASFDLLSKRTLTLLASHGVRSLQQLCCLSWLELHRLPGCGFKTSAECDDLLKALGLSYRVDMPENAFDELHGKLVKQYSEDSDFRVMGARYGITADLMYQIYSGLERAVKARDKATTAHERWRTQSRSDNQ